MAVGCPHPGNSGFYCGDRPEGKTEAKGLSAMASNLLAFLLLVVASLLLVARPGAPFVASIAPSKARSP